ncbi:MAG: glycosyl hydrolase [Acidobacteriota bacterium]
MPRLSPSVFSSIRSDLTLPWALVLAVALLLAAPATADDSTATSNSDPSDDPTLGWDGAAWTRHLELDHTSLFQGLEWRAIGPVAQGGRVVDIEPVPGQDYSFYVAYATGGLWRTDDNGVNFRPLFDAGPTQVLGDIGVDPQNPDRVWLGTGEPNSSRSSYGGVGVFRSDDGGETWTHSGLDASDRIARIVVHPRDSNRIFVAVLGRLYTPGGPRGVFRSEDGGASWTAVLDGASESGWTGAVDLVIDPQNPDVLYAATWHRERRPWDFVEGGEGSGVWKSTDGGDTWTRLGGGLPTGGLVGRIGLAIFPEDPRILYAAVDNQELLPEEEWDLGDGAVTAKRLRGMTKDELLRQDPEALEDFVRGSDLDSSIDAKTLVDLLQADELSIDDLLAELDDANAGLFTTDIKGLEIYRSDDGGATWRRTHEEPIREVVYTYGYYFGQIRVDPSNAERIFVAGVPLIRSDDGGATFEGIDGREVHVDHHALWIDPAFPGRVMSGNDGGVDVSYDGGDSWRGIDRQAVGQFYTIAVDMAEPYNVYGGLQDNGTWRGSSRSRPGLDGWTPIGGGDGMHVAVDPRDGTTYVGFQFGFYFRIAPDGTRTVVRPRDALKEPALRYNWSTPIVLSPHTADILYFGTNRLYRSTDRGETWAAISPELTVTTQRGDVPFGTLTSISESPRRFGLLWAGTDDGQVHVSRDAGATWSRVAGQGVSSALPSGFWVSRVVASHHADERAYLALNGYRADDPTAHVFVTDDLGATWRPLAGDPARGGLPSEPVNVVREDPVNEDVLYVGTDRGVYVSLDRGAGWQGLPRGLPNVPVHDLVVHPREREVVIGTHGRSAYVLDALPIQELATVRDQPVALFPVESLTYDRGWRGRLSQWFHRPEDEPTMTVPFWSAAAGEATFRVLDAEERVLAERTLTIERGVSAVTWDLLLDEESALEAERQAVAARSEDSVSDDASGETDETRGESDDSEIGVLAETPWAEAVRLGWPLYATPGTYTLEVTVGDDAATTELTVEPPSPREPRQPPEPPLRGREDDKPTFPRPIG